MKLYTVTIHWGPDRDPGVVRSGSTLHDYVENRRLLITPEEQNDVIRAQVEQEIPTPRNGFETDAERDEHTTRHEARFTELVNASGAGKGDA